MRIAFCTHAAPWAGNHELSLFNGLQAAELTALGHRTEIFTGTLGGPAWAERFLPGLRRANARPAEYVYQGVRYHAVKRLVPPVWTVWPVYRRDPGLVTRWASARYEDALARRVDRFAPDFLLVHGAGWLGPTVANLSRRLGVPFGVIEQDPIEFPRGSALGRHYVSVAGQARVVFHVGHKWVRHLRGELGLPNVRVAPNGAVTATAAQRHAPRPDRWRGKQVVLNVGTMRLRWKAHEELFRALAELIATGPGRDVVLLTVGSPQDELRALAATLGIAGHVEFLPRMTVQEVQQYMVWADLFALPSWGEAFGLVYAEAMAAGTPVLMTHDCGAAFLIEPGRHGWVVPPRDHAALVAALAEALTTADLPAMGRAGRALVEARYTWRRSAETLVAGIRGDPDPHPDPVVPEHWFDVPSSVPAA